METKSRKKGGVPRKESNRPRLDPLKATFSISIKLEQYMSEGLEAPGKRIEAAQEIADTIHGILEEEVPPVTPAASVGSSGRIWSIFSSMGGVKISHTDEKPQEVKLEFFGFGHNSNLAKRIRTSFKDCI